MGLECGEELGKGQPGFEKCKAKRVPWLGSMVKRTEAVPSACPAGCGAGRERIVLIEVTAPIARWSWWML